MGIAWWILVLAVGAPIAWHLFKVFVGAVVPPEVSGRQLLKQELRKYGTDPNKLPEACILELTEHSVRTARAISEIRGKSLTNEVVDKIEATAMLVSDDLKGSRQFEDSYTTHILRKHVVIR